MNTLMIIVILGVVVLGIFYALKGSSEAEKDELNYEINSLIEFAKRAVEDELGTEYLGRDSLEYKRRERRKIQLKAALDRCTYGSLKDKMYVLSYLEDILTRAYDFTDETIDQVIPFSRKNRLTPRDKFDILLYYYKEILKYRYSAFSVMVDKYGLHEPKFDEVEGEYHYTITKEDIERVFDEEDIRLDLKDKIKIVTQRIYASHWGLGVIDELRDQKIDGISGGVSGIPEEVAANLEIEDVNFKVDENDRAHDSVWILFRGITTRLAFLSFETEEELRRVVFNVYAYGSPGQLNQSNGHKINEMADGSRVVALAPRLTESWAFFIRKFDADLVDINKWFKKRKGFEDIDDNRELIIGWLEFLAKGARTTIFTGQQGAGKTTLMRACIKFFYRWWTIRIQEGTSFELWLRKSMKWRNIVTFREIEKVPASKGIVIQKKTDGELNLVGEIADDETFVVAMKTGQVASRCTWASHHGQTPEAIIDAYVDAASEVSPNSDNLRSERYASRVIKFNVHLANDQGFRYVQRVSEYIPLADKNDYPRDFQYQASTKMMFLEFMKTMTEYFYRETDRRPYITQNIIEYRNGKYVAVAKPTEENINAMLANMTDRDKERFKDFLDKHFAGLQTIGTHGVGSA
jgi:pilus assembly protein CpaF